MPEPQKELLRAEGLTKVFPTGRRDQAVHAVSGVDLTIYEHTGEMFNADVNARLIENIFFKNSPLHDGAMIIADNHIKAAGCILPVAQTAQLPKEMGLRHRSGLGMSLETDAIVIIVSEERGKISVAHNGKIEVNVTAEELQQILAREKEVTNYC